MLLSRIPVGMRVGPPPEAKEGHGSLMAKLFLDDERDPREWLPDMRWFRGRVFENAARLFSATCP